MDNGASAQVQIGDISGVTDLANAFFIPSPWIIAFPEEEVIEGFNWEAGATVTLTILTGEQLLFQTMSVAGYPDWDPSTTYVRFDVKALGYSDLERGDHIVMTDERTTRDLFVPVLYVDVINLETNTISGSGEPYSEITIVGIQEEPVVVTVQGNGSWTANFAELPPGTWGSAIQYDEDGDETRVNFYIPNVELSPGYSQDAAPGSVVTYTHVLTNTGTTTDTFTLDATSSQGWPVSLLSVTGTLNLPLQLDAGLSATFLISLSVPTAAINGTVDTAVITATSQTSPTLSAVAVDTTTVKNVTWYVYLPLVLKRWPPIPDVPVLNPISNPDGDGSYTVSWNAAYLASTYTLQEDDNAAFSSPTTQYAGPGTFWPASGKPAGTHYYRVKATNVSGDSGWSNVQSVNVSDHTILYEDFEGSFPGPWRVSDYDGTSFGEYYWAKRNCRAYAGSYSGRAIGGGANGASLGCGSSYANHTESWMVYGPFSLVGASAGDLSFKLWLNSESNYDGVCRLASIDGVNFYGTCTSGNTGGWVDKVLDLTNVYNLGNLMSRPNVWVALVFYSDEDITYPEGAHIDNIVLRKCASACPALNVAAPKSANSHKGASLKLRGD